MLFEFELRGNAVYCVADFYDSFVKDCMTVHIEFLCKDYTHSTSLVVSLDTIQDVRLLQSLIYKQVCNCIDSFINESVVFKRNWNRYCDSVPKVYQFEKEVLFNDSKIKKFSR